SWICAFSGDGYAAATQNTPAINILLYKKIPATDVRKGWWLDENLHSPNWANLTWVDPKDASVTATGDAIANFTTSDGGKDKFLPYTNIKFGMKSGVGSTINNNDWPLMRVEEMILIQAEGLAKSGNEGKARTILENFVKTYRDPSYDINGRGLSLENEIWFQRRVELWGEGFFIGDAKRLNRPVVRFHGPNTSNEPQAFQFNVAADDPYMNMRFPQAETNYNLGIVPNEETGTQPNAGQNPGLRDGVTD
ncbi:MAG: RagB/SusD family nutrient uptake outer membrane protein, partial [Prevotella sp.]|nr:RagB/SusD family nutrient uptake outer membrane protein [Prevotella sp.]